MRRSNPAVGLCALVVVIVGLCRAALAEVPETDYAVVASTATLANPAWSNVVQALCQKHHAALVCTAGSPAGATDGLSKFQPRYVAFVARPEELDVQFVREIHLMSRAMDADPFADFYWGIITGYSANDALRIVRRTEPLSVKRSLNTTGVNPELFDEVLTLSDANPPGNWQQVINGRKESGREDPKGPGHAARFADFFTNHSPDLLVTSGHATEVNLELPFGMGSLICWSNHLYALERPDFVRWVRAMSAGESEGGLWFCSPDYPRLCGDWIAQHKPIPLAVSTNSKVLLAAGNCLIGDAQRSLNSMVITWLSAGGVDQFVGYTVPTWYGRGGWGTLQIWESSRGALNLSEAFFLNNQRVVQQILDLDPELNRLTLDDETAGRLTGERRGGQTDTLRKLEKILPRIEESRRRDAIGLLYDRDTLALYGDPKWEARMDARKGAGPLAWKWSGGKGSDMVLTLTASSNYTSGEAFLLPLPRRVKRATIVEPAAIAAKANDEFLLFPKLKLEKGKSLTVTLRGAQT